MGFTTVGLEVRNRLAMLILEVGLGCFIAK